MAADLPTPPIAGGDDTGLICGFVFEAGQQAQVLPLDTAADVLQGLRDRDAAQPGFAWLHFNLSHMGAQRWLQRQEGLAPTFHEALNDELRSTRIERDEDALVAVLNDARFDFGYEPADIATLWISVDARVVVSARRSPLRSVDRLRLAIKNGEAIASSTELLERVKLVQEELCAMLNERTSRSLFVLTIVTVLALPINILAGLFGMNVGGVPLAQDPHGFWIVAGVVLVFTGVAGWLVFRRWKGD